MCLYVIRPFFSEAESKLDVGDDDQGVHEVSESHVVSTFRVIWRSWVHVSSRPGPARTITGATATYFVPWRVCWLYD